MRKAVQEAVRKEGSLQRVAQKLGITRQAIQLWDTKKAQHRVPPKHVLAMEAMSGVSRYELRPDIYGRSAPAPRRGRPKHRAQARAAA